MRFSLSTLISMVFLAGLLIYINLGSKAEIMIDEKMTFDGVEIYACSVKIARGWPFKFCCVREAIENRYSLADETVKFHFPQSEFEETVLKTNRLKFENLSYLPLSADVAIFVIIPLVAGYFLEKCKSRLSSIRNRPSADRRV